LRRLSQFASLGMGLFSVLSPISSAPGLIENLTVFTENRELGTEN